MSTSAHQPTKTEARATRAWCDGGFIWVELADGRRVGFPPDRFPRLRGADADALARVKVEARGRALRWEELDEDVSVEGILAGRWPG